MHGSWKDGVAADSTDWHCWNLVDKDWGPVPGEYRGQPIVGGQTFKVKAGDWLVIPPDAPHQPKPDPGGFSYMIMKINVGMYPWNLVR